MIKSPYWIFGDSSFPLPSLLSSSPGVITYSSENTDVATISGSTVTVLKVGSTLITATQASTPNYELGTTSLILTIGKAIPTISGFTDFTKHFVDTFINLIELQISILSQRINDCRQVHIFSRLADLIIKRISPILQISPKHKYFQRTISIFFSALFHHFWE